MQARGESVEDLPQVTVFEKTDSPGGGWRSERCFSASPDWDEKKDSDHVDASHNTQMVRLIPVERNRLSDFLCLYSF